MSKKHPPAPSAPIPASLWDSKDFWPMLLLLGLIALLYGETISFPPRSDHWHAFYFFANVPQNSHGLAAVAHYALLGHSRFQPLATGILYGSWKIFHEAFYLHNIIHLSLYAGMILCFYALAKKLTTSRLLAFFFSALLAAGYSHFDLVAWSYHIHIPASILALFLLGFFLHRFCEQGRPAWIWAANACALIPMLSYEPFLPAPFFIYAAFAWARPERRKILMFHGAVTYSLLGILGLAYRHASFYSPSVIAPEELFSTIHLRRFAHTVATQILYGNLLSQFIPSLGWPPDLKPDNSIFSLNPFRKGMIIFLERHWPFFSPALTATLAALALWLRKGSQASWKLPAFLAITGCLLGYVLILCFARTLTNISPYVYVQFRYQLFPNLCILALAALALGELWPRATASVKTLTCVLLAASTAGNLYCSGQGISMVQEKVGPHQRLLNNIRRAMHPGGISPVQKLYIDPAIVRQTGMWNQTIQMAHDFPGTVEWLFHDRSAFTLNPDEAAWTLAPDMRLLPLTTPKTKL